MASHIQASYETLYAVNNTTGNTLRFLIHLYKRMFFL